LDERLDASPPPGDPARPAARSVARSVALIVIVFAATLAMLFGLTDIVGRRPVASGLRSTNPTSIGPVATATATAIATPTGSVGASSGPSASSGAGAADPVILAAGDIADCTTDDDEATARLLDGVAGTVVALGDIALPNGSAAIYRDCYMPTWGRHLSRTRPTPGERDWATPHLAGYLGVFGPGATTDGHPWYSFDIGTWHAIVLDSDCGNVAGCGPDSAQGRWLATDLVSSHARCTIAIWHRPRFSSGQSGDDPAVAPFWDALYAAGADVVLTAHDADYERFAPQDPSGKPDRDHGLREFVVGTGGAPLGSFLAPRPNSELRVSLTHGVLQLTLHSNGYDWNFLPTVTDFHDRGSASCH